MGWDTYHAIAKENAQTIQDESVKKRTSCPYCGANLETREKDGKKLCPMGCYQE